MSEDFTFRIDCRKNLQFQEIIFILWAAHNALVARISVYAPCCLHFMLAVVLNDTIYKLSTCSFTTSISGHAVNIQTFPSRKLHLFLIPTFPPTK
jgi:hypothetical protein